MLSRSSLLSMFCSKGSSEASRSSSALRRSRCRFDGLLLVTPSLGGGFRLHIDIEREEEKGKVEKRKINFQLNLDEAQLTPEKGSKLLIALIS